MVGEGGSRSENPGNPRTPGFIGGGGGVPSWIRETREIREIRKIEIFRLEEIRDIRKIRENLEIQVKVSDIHQKYISSKKFAGDCVYHHLCDLCHPPFVPGMSPYQEKGNPGG